MTSCSNAASTSKKLSFLCYKLQEKITEASQIPTLLNLARELESNVATFSAAEFFEINNNTLFGILASATTYFIIIIQFNSAVAVKN